MTTALPLPTSSTTRLAGTADTTRHPLQVRLEREWLTLSARPANVDRARSWGLGVTVRTLDDIVAATGWYDSSSRRLGATPTADTSTGTGTAADADEPMRVLLSIAQHDQLAARVVLQRLLPGLVAIARRWQRRHDGDAFGEVVAAAWTVIGTYPLQTRPRHLVANLLNDSEYHAFRRAGRRLLQQVPVEHRHLDGASVLERVEPMHELAEVVSCTRSLCAADRRLLSLLLSGRTMLEVADVLQVSERTVRNHRAQLVAMLRGTVRLAAAA